MVIKSVAAVSALIACVLAGCGGGGGGGGVVACGAVGCGGAGNGGSTPSDTIPVAAANSPLIGVMMRVDCANGTSGSGSIGDSANPGIGTLVVNGTCTPPLKITAIGSGKMRPIGAQADGSEDLPYDPAVSLPVSAVLTSLPTAAAPAVVNPVSMLVAERLVPGTATPAALTALTGATLSAAQVAVAVALGVGSSEIGQDYLNANIAAAATRIAEVAALATAQVASNGMPAAVNGGTTLGMLLAQGLANQAANGAAMTTAAGMAGAAMNIDPATLDATTAATLAKIDEDSARTHNLVALAQASSAVNLLADISNNAARMASDARAAAAPTAQQQQLVRDANARLGLAATQAIQSLAAKMVADVAGAVQSLDQTEKDTKNALARAAARKIINDLATALTQAGANPANLAALGKVVADSIDAAIKSDITAATKAFATPPLIGTSNAAAALVGQAQKTALGVTAKSFTGFDAAVAGSDVLKVGWAIKDVSPPAAGATVATQKAFEAAVTAIAALADGASASNSSANTAGITATINSIQAKLLAAMGGANAAVDSSTALIAQQVAQQALQTALGSPGIPLNIAAPPAVSAIIVASPLPTTICDPFSSPPAAGAAAACKP
ncbi:MAG: hypothetical protein NTY41_00875 [Proteobacteria bacterium]|nr:hypothetical protein [Pseudomonadota bacterium]